MAVKMLGEGEAAPQFAAASSVSLPTQGNVPPIDLEAFSYYIYGQHKIGKTSFTSMFRDAFHLFYEPGGKDYKNILFREPKNWTEFMQYVVLLEDQKRLGTLPFKTVILDPVDLCYRDCLVHFSRQACGKDYPPMNDFGKTWNLIGDQFRDAIYRLAKVSGVVFVSHAKEQTITKSDDTSYEMIRPTSANKCHEILSKFCDMTGYFHMNTDNKRVLRILPDMHMESGNRFENHFRYAGTTKPMHEILMGESKQDAYLNFLKAFNNQVVEGTKEEPKAAVPSATPGSIPVKSFSIKRVPT